MESAPESGEGKSGGSSGEKSDRSSGGRGWMLVAEVAEVFFLQKRDDRIQYNLEKRIFYKYHKMSKSHLSSHASHIPLAPSSLGFGLGFWKERVANKQDRHKKDTKTKFADVVLLRDESDQSVRL